MPIKKRISGFFKRFPANSKYETVRSWLASFLIFRIALYGSLSWHALSSKGFPPLGDFFQNINGSILHFKRRHLTLLLSVFFFSSLKVLSLSLKSLRIFKTALNKFSPSMEKVLSSPISNHFFLIVPAIELDGCVRTWTIPTQSVFNNRFVWVFTSFGIF